MTSLHHHHQQHHQEPNKTMQQHQATHQQGGLLLEKRIIELLTETNLTFKEIVIKLEGEKLSASIGMIRRINRDNRYRRPRYDSKLSPTQRDSLVEELRHHKGMKPNLSLLAKRYGVCHGSVWYWWDKLNRIKRCDSSMSGSRRSNNLANTSVKSSGGGASSKLCVGKTELQIFTANERTHPRRRARPSGKSALGASAGGNTIGGSGAVLSGAAGIGGEIDNHNHHHRGTQLGGRPTTGSSGPPGPYGMMGTLYQQRWRNFNNILLDERYNYVGRVSIVSRSGDVQGPAECYPIVDLPILMFARKELAEVDSVKTCESGGSLDMSPSPVVVVDDSYEEDEDDDDDDDGEETDLSDSRDDSLSQMLLMMPTPIVSAAADQQVDLSPVAGASLC